MSKPQYPQIAELLRAELLSLDFLAEQLFVGPLWPASILVCLMVLYALAAVIGLVDFGIDAPEVDLDTAIDVDVDIDTPEPPDADGVPVGSDFLQGLGAASMRWTNFGRVPVVIWGGLFALGFWTISYLLWHGFDAQRYQPTLSTSTLLTIRNVVLAVAVTKVFTQPLVRYFVAPPSYDQHTLIGATCEVCTSEATPEFGQARFRTNAAPLLLNIRSDGPHLRRGEEVRIVGFHDREKRIYKVAPLSTENQS